MPLVPPTPNNLPRDFTTMPAPMGDPASMPPGIGEMMAQQMANVARQRMMQALAQRRNLPPGQPMPQEPPITAGPRG